MDIGLLILRLAVGLTLAVHGGQKLFGWFGGYGIAGTGQFLEQLGFRPGRLHAALAGLAEFGGGLLLALGLLTPAASAAVVSVMLVASIGAHWKNGFFVTKGGLEYPALLAAVAAGLAFTGPGALSADEALGLTWSFAAGAAALGAGILAGALLLVTRRWPTAESALRRTA
jgi:putative oxidoreductase